MRNVIYLTKEGLEKLENELKYLKENKRLEIADKLREAISFGDLSENAEYEEARNEQAQVELRISELEEQLKRVQIIEESKGKKDNKINIGATIKILDIKEKEELSYKIVGSTESNILDEKNPRISNESPVGNALLGSKKGDIVKVKAPAGVFEYKVLEIN